MNMPRLLLLLCLFVCSSSIVLADSHYTFEHAEEMRTSGRIDWYDYGPEAFNDAIEQNKPIFLMLTAPTWCYWCHVYTSDAYVYHPDIYPTINEQFIPIYVDADQRQDLTRQYLEGGWPSTTVMTPSRERLFGYSGPRPHQFMLQNMNSASAFVSTQGFTNTIQYEYTAETGRVPTAGELTGIVNSYAGNILGAYDQEHGGFGTGQKFPQGLALDFALDVYEISGDQRFLELVQNTLANQYTAIDELDTNYNLFDPVDGGFHRYGTTRTYTPPHYEKMLYDNVRLLQAYEHLRVHDGENEILTEVLDKTHAFMADNWWDDAHGGFYGNSDVHGEDAYFGFADRSDEKPRVEQTKYSDWNSDAVFAYASIYRRTSEQVFLDYVTETLDFFADNMITDGGALHYIKPDGEKGVSGTLLDNSYLLVAFITSYELTQDRRYLDVAVRLADFSLEHLYDWHGGGFFERNSPDLELYAPGEHIRLHKPTRENGVIAYGMMRTYWATQDIRYLNAALKTMARYTGGFGTLDRGYYFAITAQQMLGQNLLQDYENGKDRIGEIEAAAQENFWVEQLIADTPVDFAVDTSGASALQGSIFLLLVIALIAGLLSFISPCTLPILPAYFAYMIRSSKQNMVAMTMSFFLGLVTVFTILGLLAASLGSLINSFIGPFSQVAGALLVVFGVMMILGIGFVGIHVKQSKPTSLFGSFIFGATLGVTWTPCVGPILVAILILASTTGSALTGGLLLAMYGIGLSLPLVFITLCVSKINKKNRLWSVLEGRKFVLDVAGKKFVMHTTSIVAGLLFVILGYLIFNGALFSFNQYIAGSELQKSLYAVEDWLLNLVR